MIHFFGTFFLLLLFGCLVIVGWFMVTRGEIIEREDGSKKKDGSIFKFWQIFWERKKEPEFIRYIGKHLFEIKRDVEQALRQIGVSPKLELHEAYIESKAPITEEQIKEIEYLTNTVISVSTVVYYHWVIYKKEDCYVFPEVIRSPIASCPTCHASIYGTIIFFVSLWLIRWDLFYWTDHRTTAIILTWIAYCFSLAVLNTYVYKLVNKNLIK